MSPPSPGAVLLFVLRSGAMQAAESLAAPRRAVTARFDLSAGPPEATPVFDSRVVVGAVDFQPMARFADWALGQEGLSLHVSPKGDYLPGERQEDKARLLAEREEPGGLMDVAWLDGTGVVASNKIFFVKKPAKSLGAGKAWIYIFTPAGETHPARVAVWLRLDNPGAKPWTLAGASLEDSTGEQVALAIWPKAPLAPGSEEGLVVAGTHEVPKQLRCPCTIRLWEEGGPRTVIVRGVEFPAASPMRE